MDYHDPYYRLDDVTSRDLGADAVFDLRWSRPTTSDDRYTWTREADASGYHESRREENTHRTVSNSSFESLNVDEILRFPNEYTHVYSDSNVSDDFRQPGQTRGDAHRSRQMQTIRLPGRARSAPPLYRDSDSFLDYDVLLEPDQTTNQEPYSNQMSSQRTLSSYAEDESGIILEENGGSGRTSRQTSEEDERNTPKDINQHKQRGTSGLLPKVRTDQSRKFSHKVGIKAKLSTTRRKGKARVLKVNKKANRLRNSNLHVISEESAIDSSSSYYDATPTSQRFDNKTSSSRTQQDVSANTENQLAVLANTPSCSDMSNSDSSTYFENIECNKRLHEKQAREPAYKFETIYERKFLDKTIESFSDATNSVCKNTFHNGAKECYNVSSIEQDGTQREMTVNKKHKRPPMHIYNHTSETDCPEYAFGTLNLDKSSTNVETLWKSGITSQDFKSSTIFNDPDLSSHAYETVSVNEVSKHLDDTSPQFERSSSSSSFISPIPSKLPPKYNEESTGESANQQKENDDGSPSLSDTQDRIEILFAPTKRNHNQPLESIPENDVNTTSNSSSMSNRVSSSAGKSSAPFFRSIETQTSAIVITVAEKDPKPTSRIFSSAKNSLRNIIKDHHKVSICTQCPSIKIFARERNPKAVSSKVTKSCSKNCMESKCGDSSDIKLNTESPREDQGEQSSKTKETEKPPQSSSSTGKYTNQGNKRCLCSSLKSRVNKWPKSSETKRRKKSINFSFLETYPGWKKCLSHITFSASAQGERLLKSLKTKRKHPCLEVTSVEAGTNNKQNDSNDATENDKNASCKNDCAKNRKDSGDKNKDEVEYEGEDKDKDEDEDEDKDSLMTQQANSPNVELKGSNHGGNTKSKLPSTSTVQMNVDGSGKATIEWGPNIQGTEKDAGKSRKPKKQNNSKDKDEDKNVSIRWGRVHIEEYKDGSKVFTFSNSVTKKPRMLKSDVYIVFVVPPSAKKTNSESSKKKKDKKPSSKKPAKKSSSKDSAKKSSSKESTKESSSKESTKKSSSKDSAKKSPSKDSTKKSSSKDSTKKSSSKESAGKSPSKESTRKSSSKELARKSPSK